MEISKTPGKKPAAKNMKFEEAMLRIEEIARQLEDETLDLDTALKLYEEGKKCISFCDKKITAAEQKVCTLDSFLQAHPERGDSSDE